MRHLLERIVFICNPVFTYGKIGWSPNDDFLAGTEESVREWAWRIKQRGYDVEVYYNGKPDEYKGVHFLPYEAYIPGDVEVNVKYLDFHHADPSKVWYLTNETDIGRKEDALVDYAGVIFPSKWALDNLHYHGHAKIVPHGYDPALIHPETKIKKQCLYASSPDRGLSELLDFWPEVVRRDPEAYLIVTYAGIDTTAPNVMFMGAVDELTMSTIYNTSDFWLHPCSGGELFCMAAVKAQVAQAVPVYYPVMALTETVRWGVRSTSGDFVNDLVSIMNDPIRQQQIRYKLQSEHFADWEDATDILLNAIGANSG